MKRLYRVLVVLILTLLFISMMPFKAEGSQKFVIDGYSDEWENLPSYYTYNWDNSQNCWVYGVWINGVKYLTPKNTYDTTVRHRMQIYTDNTYIYLLIEYSLDYQPLVNGDDFNFTVNSESHKFRIAYADNQSITGNVNKTVTGTNKVYVTTYNNRKVEGADAALNMKNNRRNNMLEMRLPLSEFKMAGKAGANEVKFFTPNLMYESISCAGTPTYASPILITLVIFIIIGYIKHNGKDLKKYKER